MRAFLALVAVLAAAGCARTMEIDAFAPPPPHGEEERIRLEPVEGRMIVRAFVPSLGGEAFNLVVPKTIGSRELEFANDTPAHQVAWSGPDRDGAWTAEFNPGASGRYTLVLAPHADSVDMEMRVWNQSRVPWTEAWAFTFLAPVDPESRFADPHRDRTFVQRKGRPTPLAHLHEPRGPRPEITAYLHERAGRVPFLDALGQTSDDRIDGDWMVRVARGGDAWLAVAAPRALFGFNNRTISSLHAAPLMGTIPPGGSAVARARFHFGQGGLDEALARLEADRAPQE